VRAAFNALNEHDYQRACALAGRGQAACLALVRTNVVPHLQPVSRPATAPTGYGYGPSSLQSAYKLPSSSAGSGQTVALVDAYNDPDAASDLATYRAAWGLPACGAGCFSVVNENGATSPLPVGAAGTGWDLEESRDVDMVSAICPNTGCTHRTNNDVSAVADPNTGVAVYDSYIYGGWVEVGGTSVASPIIAATFALAGPPVAGTYPSSYLYQHPWDLFDVTSGSDGSCTPAYLCSAQVGYDAPTGWGTPDGTAVFTDSPHWSSWLSEIGAPSPGIASGSSPAVSSWGPNRLGVFVRGADNAIWHAWWDGTNWSNVWDSRGPAITSSPAAASWSTNRIDLFGIATNGDVYHQYYG
jgi:hypothetical protein